MAPSSSTLALAWWLLAAAPAASGILDVHFFYNPPGTVEPTYHTAMWLEDAHGRIVATLFVSQELSATEYKVGNACPDWVRQSHWATASKSDVAAVTAPTPNVGTGELSFDLTKLRLDVGTYGFRFQVHISDDYNVLYRGSFTIGGPDGEVKLETMTGPGKMPSTEQFVRDVEVRYRR